MPPTLVINVAGLSRDLLAEVPCLREIADAGALFDLEPVLPATTCPMQATLTTGVPPGRSDRGPGHGIVADGLYDPQTAEVRFWEQSARLLTAPRVWERRNPKSGIRNPKVAMLFWQQSMFGSADVLVTPKPIHGPQGLIQDCYSRPADLYARLAAGESALRPGTPRGPFNLMDYWGPLAGLGASRWIADATLAVWRDERPDLLLTYLPHLDYSGHRDGPDADAHRAAAADLEPLVAPLLEAAKADGARILVLSEYTFVPVARPVAPNRALREAGLLAVREVQGAEYLYVGDCRAFALVDNQVAHVYFPASPHASAEANRVRPLLADLSGVAEVLDREALAVRGLDHPRSGDLVLLAEPDAHFTYYWWTDDAKAPPLDSSKIVAASGNTTASARTKRGSRP